VIKNRGKPSIIVITLTASLGFTLLLLYIGTLLSTLAPLPNRVQAMTANVIFDGLTIMVTFWILERSSRIHTLLRLPLVIVTVGGISFLFALCSLWFATLGSGWELTILFGREISFANVIEKLRYQPWVVLLSESFSISEMTNIIIGKNPFGTYWEFGPLFWSTNSVFLPLALYLIAVTTSWLAKVVHTAVALYLGRGKEEEINPISMTAALFALISAIFVACSLGMSFLTVPAELST
jgi:hypothetical protein